MGNLWFALWFFLPAGAANVTPVLLAKAPGLRNLDAPVDGRMTFRGKRLLGDHKTWRGLITGVLAAILVIWLQAALFRHLAWAKHISHQVDYSVIPVTELGFLLGSGALGGDMVKSFIKRQIDVRPGHSWFPFDQLDYIAGGLLLSLPVVRLTLTQYIWIFTAWFAIHLFTSYIGYYLKLKSTPI